MYSVLFYSSKLKMLVLYYFQLWFIILIKHRSRISQNRWKYCMTSLTLRLDLLNVLKITDTTLENIYADCFLTTSEKNFKRQFNFLENWKFYLSAQFGLRLWKILKWCWKTMYLNCIPFIIQTTKMKLVDDFWRWEKPMI